MISAHKVIPYQPPNSDEPPIPAYHPIYQRPLTDEEIAHFEALPASYSPKL